MKTLNLCIHFPINGVVSLFNDVEWRNNTDNLPFDIDDLVLVRFFSEFAYSSSKESFLLYYLLSAIASPLAMYLLQNRF
mgnify:CR=1 FL=1